MRAGGERKEFSSALLSDYPMQSVKIITNNHDDENLHMIGAVCVIIISIFKGFCRSPVSRHFLYSVTPPLPYSKDFFVSPVSRNFWGKKLEG